MADAATHAPTQPDPDVAQQAIEYCYEQGWSDGLPLVPASRPLVDRFLAHTRRDPDEVIGHLEQVDRSCTVELAAINAAMAGCRPEYFPVVLAAWDALQLDRAAKGGGWQSTSGPAPLLIVNGPVRAQLGFNATGGVFGPGFRANMTVARAVGLMVRNTFGLQEQVLAQATQGIPGRFQICVAENEEESPWAPLADDAGLPAGSSAVSAMLLRTSEYIDNRHTQDAEQILWDFADTIARTGALIFRDAACGIVMNPEHAQMLAKAGYSKADVQAWLMEHAGPTRRQLRRAGKDGLERGVVRQPAAGSRHPDREQPGVTPRPDPDGGGDLEEIQPILSSPLHIPIVVAGSRNAAISMVVRVFGLWSGTAVPVEEPPAAAGGGERQAP